MQPIIATINPGETGPQVVNLQDALVLLARDIIRPLDTPNRPTLEELQELTKSLVQERKQSIFGNATRQVVVYFQLQQGLGDNLRGVVEEKTSAKLNELLKSIGALDGDTSMIVRGTVTTADNQPIRGASVIAFDRDLRKLQQFARAETNERGEYSIPYSSAKFASADVPSAPTPKLIVRAFVGDQQIGDDISRPHPTRDEVVDFKASAPVVSEWEKLSAGVMPLLEGQGEGDQALPPWEVNDGDLDFIAEETGLEREKIRLWALAFTVSREAEAAKPPVAVISAIFYGWFRLGLPTEPSALWLTPTDKLLASVRTAIAQGIVPSNILADLDGIRARIEQIKLDRILQAPSLGTTASLGDLFATLPVSLDVNHQRAIAAALPGLQPDDPKLVQRIAAVPGFDGDAIGVARILRLGALTAGHLPMAQALQTRLQGAKETAGTEGTLRPLADIRPDEWLDLAYTHGAPNGSALTPVAYADALAASVERQHPTAALAAHFADGRRLAQQPALSDVGTFLRHNPSFDIVTENLNMLSEEAVLDGVANPQQLVEGLRMLSRWNLLGVRWEEAATLHENDLHSPQKLLDAGPGQLAVLLDGQLTPGRVAELHARAEDLYATTVAAFTAALSPFSGPRIMPEHNFVFGGGNVDPRNPNVSDGPGTITPRDRGPLPNTEDAGSIELKSLAGAIRLRGGQFDPNKYKFPPAVRSELLPIDMPLRHLGGTITRQPTLQALFGAQDSCVCGHCNSVLSPAAYFVDVLQFLKNAGILGERHNGNAGLLALRPDLQDLELSCNNTNTEVSAIDLALEILENAVALPLNVALQPGTNIAEQLKDGSLVGDAVKDALKKTVRELFGEVRAKKEGDAWTVVDGHRRWTLSAEPEVLKASIGTEAVLTLDMVGVNLPELKAALDQKLIPKGAEAAFGRVFVPHQRQPPDFANYDVTVTPSKVGHSWDVSYSFVTQLRVDTATNQIRLRSRAGDWSESSYHPKTIEAVQQDLAKNTVPELVRRLVASRVSDTRNLRVNTIESGLEKGWTITSDKPRLTLNVTPARVTITSLAYQSGDAKADAIAEPENHNPEAYVWLKGNPERAIPTPTFPWSLPVDLPLEEVRLFLDRARSPRRKLIEVMLPVGQSLSDDKVFAREVLGLSEAEAKLIASQSPTAEEIYACWGLSPESKSIWDAAAGEDFQAASPLELLKNVSILLQQSRLTFAELQALLATRFVSSAGAPLLIEPRDTCVPSKMRIIGLTSEHLDRVHRFIRLWRKLDWSMRELDLAIQAFGGQLQDDTCLSVACVERLKQELELPVTALVGGLDLYETRPWTDYLSEGAPVQPSLYATIFQNEALRSVSDYADFALQIDGITLVNKTALGGISAHAKYVGACLGIKSSVVVDWMSDTHGLGIEDTLTLANLSRLTAGAHLCHALGMSAEKFTHHLKLYGMSASPFPSGMSAAARAHAMLEFVRRFRLVEQSGVDAETLRYLLQHYEAPGSNSTLDQNQLAQLVSAAHDAVRSIPDAPTELLPPLEAKEPERVEAALVIRRKTEDAIQRNREDAIIAALATGLSGPRELVDDLLRTRLRHPYNPSKAAIDVFVSSLFSVHDFKDVERLIEHLRSGSTRTTQYVMKQFSFLQQEVLKDSSANIQDQQDTLIVALNDLVQGASIYKASGFPGITLSPDTLALQMQQPTGAELARLNRQLLEEAFPKYMRSTRRAIMTILVRLHKTVFLCDALTLGPTDLKLLRKPTLTTDVHGLTEMDFGLTALQFNALPDEWGAALAPADVESFTQFEQLMALVHLRDIAPRANDLLHQYAALNSADSAYVKKARQVLAVGLLGSDEVSDEVKEDNREYSEVKTASEQLGITTVDQYRDPIILARLIALLAALKQLGTTVAQAVKLTIASPDDPVALAARTLLRSKFGDSSWHDLIKPIADKLRTRQRDALVDYLIGDSTREVSPRTRPIGNLPRLRDANDLYELYLIDVETGSCLKTTRLLQATAAAQLFVQRLLLNLDGGMRLTDDKRRLWDPMHLYRVWEANRKVFLFPENWLMPELRDDKTATFRQMESALTEQQPLPEITRAALLGYVEELGDLAQISVIAMYQDRRIVDTMVGQDGVTRDVVEHTLYVVGRTPDQPYRYFWRSCADFGGTGMQWSGWESLDLDNANDFIMPFVFEGDLLLAWPIFHKTKEEKKSKEDTAKLLWEVQIAWTRRTTKGWVKRKIGNAQLDNVPRLLKKDASASFAFRLNKTDSQLVFANNMKPLTAGTINIDCYAADEELPKTMVPYPFLFTNNNDKGSLLNGTGTRLQQSNGSKQWNVGLTVRIIAFQYATIEEGEDKYCRGLEGVDVWIIATQKTHENPGDQVRPVYKGDLPGLNQAAIRTNTDGLAEVSIPADTAVFHNGKNGGEGVFTASEFTVILRHPSLVGGQETQHVLLKQFENGEWWVYANWDWTFSIGVEKVELKNKFDPDREVNYVKAGTFIFESGKDIRLDVETPDPLPDTIPSLVAAWFKVPMSVDGNRFSRRKLDAKFNNIYIGDDGLLSPTGITPLMEPPIFITRACQPSGPSDSAEPYAWYLQDNTGGMYLQRQKQKDGNNIWRRWPDGQPFAPNYRMIASLSSSALFDPAIEAHVHVDPDANTFLRTLPCANYNWELFLHVPLAIADHLANQQCFDDARRWLHAVFDPTTSPNKTSGHLESWRFLPFSNDKQVEAIAEMLTWLANPTAVDPKFAADQEAKEKIGVGLANQIAAWRKNPFMPHVIARLRSSAYQWYALFAYLDVLIGWGDQQFRRDTRESVNEATLLYVLAAKLLGPRPRVIPAATPPAALTYRLLQAGTKHQLDDLGNAWINYADLPGVKQLLSAQTDGLRSSLSYALRKSGEPSDHLPIPTADRSSGTQLLTSLSALAFCIPQNEKLTEFYDRIEDRLFKVRNCRNIDGIFRELPLYEPPIDPLLLIRAKAAGLDIDSAIASLYAPLPHYRFSFTLQKALELAGELKALGGALLTALEKQDAEELTLLRSSHEMAMLKLVSETRKQQQAEAEANIVALQQSEETVRQRFGQYQKLLGKKTGSTTGQDGLPVVEQSSSLSVSADPVGGVSGLGLSRREVDQLLLTAEAHELTKAVNAGYLMAGILSIFPNIWAGGVFAGQTFGGANLGNAASAIAKAMEMAAADKTFLANQAGTFGGYERRQDEWVHQSNLALAELKQIKKQVLAAEIRKEIAKLELRNHETQIENAEKVDEFMRGKFSNKQLYRWISSQIAEVYFRTYQLALDQAKRAEQTYRYELGLDAGTASFIGVGHWDNLKKGLMAGDRLYHDLKRMEIAFLNQNKREFELTKHISLVLLNPLALVTLRETGKCLFRLPEELFDLDYPGHYFRRIKSVSLTLPCVVGPYTTISCTLRLVKNSIRINTSTDSSKGYPHNIGDDGRFVENHIPVKAIAVSGAQNDSGMFELSFRDERYLPFEGAGAVSDWSLELFNDNNPDFGKILRQFDYGTISDAILHVKYTAREDAGAFKDSVIKHLRTYFKQDGATPALRMFNLRQEFPSQWQRFLNPTNPADGNVFELEMARNLFPFRDQGKKLKVNSIWLLARCTNVGTTDYKYKVRMAPPFPAPLPLAADPNEMTLASGDEYGGLYFARKDVAALGIKVVLTKPPVKWQIKMTNDDGGNLQAHPATKVIEVEDVLLVLGYEWE